MANNTLTDAIYWAAQDPKVQAIANIPATPDGVFDISARESLAKMLFTEGFSPDRAIWIEGWAPARTMEIRQAYGYTSFPNAYATTPLIAVSTDAKDYPVFVAPPPPFVPSTSPIGAESSGQFSVNPLGAEVNGKLMFKDGDKYTESTGTYTFHLFPGMFGAVRYWTKD